VTDGGCLPIKTPVAGSNYLTGFNCNSSVVGNRTLVDVMWVNSGLVPATITAQSITSPSWPARDNNGSTQGEGCYAGLLVTTVCTNAGAFTNMTMTYTNSDGVNLRTATVASFPQTAVVGTVVWFLLAAGDRGVRSIEAITLGTSLGTGAVSAFVGRILADVGNNIVNTGTAATIDPTTGVKLYAGTCALLMGLMSGTGATTISGQATVSVR